jgi:acetyl-CoA carboxylase carboxyltransferase component
MTPVRRVLGELERRRAAARAMGGPDRIERQHASGRLTVRERIDLLVDAGSWLQLGLHAQPALRRPEPAPGDAIVTGLARIDGLMACVVAIDATCSSGRRLP